MVLIVSDYQESLLGLIILYYTSLPASENYLYQNYPTLVSFVGLNFIGTAFNGALVLGDGASLCKCLEKILQVLC